VEPGCIGGRIEILRAPGHDNLILADATRLPFRENYFDVITAIGLIEHLDDDQSFLHEVRRLLKPNGMLVLLTSSFPYLWSMHDTVNEHRKTILSPNAKSANQPNRVSNQPILPSQIVSFSHHCVLAAVTSENLRNRVSPS